MMIMMLMNFLLNDDGDTLSWRGIVPMDYCVANSADCDSFPMRAMDWLYPAEDRIWPIVLFAAIQWYIVSSFGCEVRTGDGNDRGKPTVMGLEAHEMHMLTPAQTGKQFYKRWQ